jgi:hypothetical protein
MSKSDREYGQEFLKNFLRAHVGKGNRRFHTMIPVDYIFKTAMWEKDSIIEDSHLKVEESIDISLRESDYEKLLELLGHFNKNGNADYFVKNYMERASYERSLRKEHPAVQKAYERYQLLLSLVSNGKDIDYD